MAIKIAQTNVDEVYSKIVEPNLYTNTWLIPGVTCTDKYTEKAGGVYVHKIVSGGKKAPTAPGQDFTNEDAADTLIPILYNNAYNYSTKIYNAQAAAVGYDAAEAHLRDNVERTRESAQSSALACLITEGTALTDTAKATAENVKELLLNARKEISKRKGTANVVLCSPDFYSTVLMAAGKEFTPETNERIITTGQVGRWMGMTFFEVNDFSNGDAVYRDSTGTAKTVAAATLALVDFVMYDARVLSYIQLLNMMRLKDSELFNGVLAQTELVAGFKVTTAECAAVKKHTA